MTNAPDLSPREAMERWLKRRRQDVRESTPSSLHYRLKLFVEWCEERDIDAMADLDGWVVDDYQLSRSHAAAVTLEKELGSVKQWLEYCQTIGLVSEDVPAAINPPSTDPRERVDETKLAPKDGEALLEYYRTTPSVHGSRAHAVVEIFWTTGCRVGALVALDVGDVDLEGNALEFHHRPDTGTPLKNGVESERDLGIREETVAALRAWSNRDGPFATDEYGRKPFFPTHNGRPIRNTVRNWCYEATLPCHHTKCPHGKARETCGWTSITQATRCPSSRSPHQLRTDSLTWQRSRGVPAEVVSDRADASVRTVNRHYDQEDRRRELEERRRDHLDKLDLDDDPQEDGSND